ncbi:group 1 glycosyl transferase, partial [Halorubrum sp. SP9]
VDWREFGDPDVLVTSGATTRAVITPDDTLHVNYCHSPPRWFYDLYHDRKDSLFGALSRPMIRYLRTRDMAVDPRVDHYFVNS